MTTATPTRQPGSPPTIRRSRRGPVSRSLHDFGKVMADNVGALTDNHHHRDDGPDLGPAWLRLFDLLAEIERDRDQPWRARAACLETATGEFFLDGVKWGRAVAAGERVCPGCPVREECTLYADARELEGVWGGTYRGRMTYHPRETADRVTTWSAP